MKQADVVDELIDTCLAFRVRLIARTVSGIYDRAVAGHGVSIAQVNLLAAVGKIGPCAPGRLGEVLHLERSTVSRNLDLLLAQGWIEAVSSDAKGLREVSLTAKGRQKIDAVMPDWRAAQDETRLLLGASGSTAVRAIAESVWTRGT